MLQNRFRVIDAHCHVYPDKILPAATEATAAFYGEKAHHSGSVKELLQAGTAAGIDHFVIQSVATKPKQVQSINEFIAATAAASPDRFTGLGTAHPESPDMAADIRHLIALGLHGVKIHPDIQGYPLDHPGYRQLCALCAQAGLPLLIHTGDRRYDNSNPNRLLPLLHTYPSLTVVAAHLGGYTIWEQAAQQLPGQPNLYVDCSSSLGYLSPQTARQIIRRYGADRVLFGTDHPLHDVTDEVQRVLALELTPEEYDRILWRNAVQIYGVHI